jgi:hypothetical protein
MDNITIDIYNKNAARYADLDIDKVSLKAFRDFSHALPRNGIVLDYGWPEPNSFTPWSWANLFLMRIRCLIGLLAFLDLACLVASFRMSWECS